MQEIEVSIIIVNYNTIELLRDCIKSIKEKTLEVSYEIIVSDNGSKDGSIEMLKTEFPDVILIENNYNLGFGKANNIGAKKAHGKYFFFLNSDTLLINNAIDLFYKNEKKDNYILGSYLLNSDLQMTWSYGTFQKPVTYIKRFQTDFFPRWIFEIRREKAQRQLKEEIKEKSVDFVTGADLFVSKKIFNELNGFDERIFMYSEDTDLGRRASLLGYKSWLITEPQIIHLEGKSSTNSAKKHIMREKSLLYYLWKFSASKNEFKKIVFIYKFISFFRFFSFNYTWGEKKAIKDNLYNTAKKLMEEEKIYE